MTKLKFVFSYLAFSIATLVSFLTIYYLKWLDLNEVQFLFAASGFVSVSILSLLIIAPAVGKHGDSFVFYFLLLTVGQLLYMLSFILYEIFTFENQIKTLVFSQLILFLLLLVYQTIILYQYSRNQV